MQLQAQFQVTVPQPDLDVSNPAEDDIDAALTDLQVSLEGSSVSNSSDIHHVPELQDELRLFKYADFCNLWIYLHIHVCSCTGQRNLVWRITRNSSLYWKTLIWRCSRAVMKRRSLQCSKSTSEVRESSSSLPFISVVSSGCEATPDINISARKYNMKIFVPSSDGLVEYWVKADTVSERNVLMMPWWCCLQEGQYAKWMAAFRLASKGKTMADSSYEAEVQSLLAFLNMQHPAPAPAISPNQVDLQPEDFVAPCFLKKLKTKQVSFTNMLKPVL